MPGAGNAAPFQLPAVPQSASQQAPGILYPNLNHSMSAPAQMRTAIPASAG